MVKLNPLPAMKRRAENFVYGVLSKYGYPPFGRTGYNREQTEPPYNREVSPRWLKHISEQHSVINNSIEEKVQQTFRRGFSPVEKRYEAKCPECLEEYGSLAPFKLDEDISDDEVDLSKPRPCPECGDMVQFDTPDPDKLDEVRSFFERANMRGSSDLVPDRHNSVSQTFLEVCREVAHDIQIFDDGWMIFERRYILEEDGSVFDWQLEEVYRAPPQYMRYAQGDEGKIGNEYWVCLECRSKNPEDYSPERDPGECSNCGNRTYEVFAYLLDDLHGDPQQFFTRGEFAHASEYRPRFTYGYSPILSVWQEARTLEQMDEYYYEAYEKRRAPRGAIIVRSSNAESVRAWNTEQMEKLNADKQHIPTFIDDTEGSGDPLKWQSLLEEPAQMQHMEMREYFIDRISAKFGVTAVFQNASSDSGGMSQSLEIIVANRSMERLRSVFNDVFLPAMMGQLKADGWTREVAPPEEEDEQSEAQLQGRHLNNLQVAQQLGLEAEWTQDDRSDIKSGPISEAEQDENMAAGLGAMMGGEPGEDPEQDAGQTTPSGGRPEDANDQSGAPNQPEDPTTEDPVNRADDSVTSGDSGYRNPTFGDDPDAADVYDYLDHVQSQLDGADSADKRSTLVSQAEENWERVSFGPDLKTLRQRATRPDKSFQDVRTYHGGEWREDYDQNAAVRKMYELMEATQ